MENGALTTLPASAFTGTPPNALQCPGCKDYMCSPNAVLIYPDCGCALCIYCRYDHEICREHLPMWPLDIIEVGEEPRDLQPLVLMTPNLPRLELYDMIKNRLPPFACSFCQETITYGTYKSHMAENHPPGCGRLECPWITNHNHCYNCDDTIRWEEQGCNPRRFMDCRLRAEERKEAAETIQKGWRTSRGLIGGLG